MHQIDVENIRLYAFHGCLPEEAKIGSNYRVDISVWGNLSKAAITDELVDTIDYVHINKIAAEEMAIRAKLLETVVQRILNRLFKELPTVEKAKVKVNKLVPPINGDVEGVAVTMEQTRIV